MAPSVDLSESRQTELRTVTIATISIAAFFVMLRFASRRLKGVAIGIDDLMVLVALFVLFLSGAVCLLGVHYGLGKHAAALSIQQLVSYGKALLVFECIYVSCICIIKISLLLMYRRIFPTRSIKIGSLVLGALSVAWCISITMVGIFQCTPIAKAWNPFLKGHCINLKGSFIGNAVPNILTDVAILALPLQQVWKLHTNTTQKIQISFVFLLGSFVIFTSIYRFRTLFLFEKSDVTWTLATAQVWCVVECSSGIVSACLPTLGHLIHVCSQKLGFNGLSWGSRRAHASGPSTDLQTIGGTGGKPNATRNTNSGLYDEAKVKVSDSRPFTRLSGVSGVSASTAEPNEWEPKTTVKSKVRALDVESTGSDEIPLRKIAVTTEVEWKESCRTEEQGRL